jgi:glutamate/tyrosine decarboxylase-like PLP-dependent enzyme
MVERHLDLAQHLARRVDEAPDFERLADAPLNIVCFRYRPEGHDLDEVALDMLNARIGEEITRTDAFWSARRATQAAPRSALRSSVADRTRRSR